MINTAKLSGGSIAVPYRIMGYSGGYIYRYFSLACRGNIYRVGSSASAEAGCGPIPYRNIARYKIRYRFTKSDRHRHGGYVGRITGATGDVHRRALSIINTA